MRMLEAGVDEPEVIQPVIQLLPGHGDGQISHIGEVRQPHAAGLVHLAEHHLLLGPEQGAPGPDAALHGSAHAGTEVRMAAGNLLEDRHRPQAGGSLEHRHDLAVPDGGDRIGAAPTACAMPGRGQPGILLEPVGGRGAEAGLRRGDRGRVGRSMGHIQSHLAVGDMATGQRRRPSWLRNPVLPCRPQLPAPSPKDRARRSCHCSGRATPFLRRNSYGDSHPD